jgi:hypothetical protein
MSQPISQQMSGLLQLVPLLRRMVKACWEVSCPSWRREAKVISNTLQCTQSAGV